MAKHPVTVVIPTLHAGDNLRDTLDSLAAQSFQDFDVVVVDNSGTRAAAGQAVENRFDLAMIYMESNAGFGGAINQALKLTSAPLVALLNDDAPAHPGWLHALVDDATTFAEFGMFSCQIRLAGTDLLDSTGMLLSRDGSSIQRSHRRPWKADDSPVACLIPSGCAALYRRKALNEIALPGTAGPFDEDFQLYCEDTDLGLRLLWQGWRCRYVRDAIVEHRYSQTAGAASPLKAFLVERNRLFVVLKNFPLTDAIAAVLFAPARYLYQLREAIAGNGKTAAFARSSHGWQAPWLVLKAHFAALAALPRLLRRRELILTYTRVSKERFREAIYSHRATLQEVAKH
ncbi:MAG: glycosyltransferase family 2 protein [Bryobacterales bacterium]|nr:glycosyltransferase family 2 protein [Bryobacterales bacterium]